MSGMLGGLTAIGKILGALQGFSGLFKKAGEAIKKWNQDRVNKKDREEIRDAFKDPNREKAAEKLRDNFDS